MKKNWLIIHIMKQQDWDFILSLFCIAWVILFPMVGSLWGWNLWAKSRGRCGDLHDFVCFELFDKTVIIDILRMWSKRFKC